MQAKYRFLRGVVWVVGAYHIILGVILNCPVSWIVWTSNHILGATRMPDASALFLARMLGVYLVAFGVAMALAAWDPIKNRAILSIGAILVALRTLQRLVQADDLQQGLGISGGTNWVTVIVLVVLAAFLLFFRIQLYRDMQKSSAP